MTEKRKAIPKAADSSSQVWDTGVVVEQTILEVTGKATQHWDKMEQVFEERVARAINRLGVPTNQDIKKLTERIDQLSAMIQKLNTQKPELKATSTSRATRTRKSA